MPTLPARVKKTTQQTICYLKTEKRKTKKRQPTHIHVHLVFSDTQANAPKTKRAIFCQRTYKQTDKNSNSFYIEKRDSQNIKTIFADTFQNDMNRIKEVLEEKGVKQTWLAEQLGKSYNMVNGYVQNRQQPRLEVLFEIAKILGVKPQDLLKDKK